MTIPLRATPDIFELEMTCRHHGLPVAPAIRLARSIEQGLSFPEAARIVVKLIEASHLPAPAPPPTDFESAHDEVYGDFPNAHEETYGKPRRVHEQTFGTARKVIAEKTNGRARPRKIPPPPPRIRPIALKLCPQGCGEFHKPLCEMATHLREHHEMPWGDVLQAVRRMA